MSASNGVITKTTTSGKLWPFQLMSSSEGFLFTSYPSGLWRLDIMGYWVIATKPLNCLFAKNSRVRLFYRLKRLPPSSLYREWSVKMLLNVPTAVRTNSVGIWALEKLRQLPLKLHNFKIMPVLGRGKLCPFYHILWVLFIVVFENTAQTTWTSCFCRGNERLKLHRLCLYHRSFVLSELSKVRLLFCRPNAQAIIKLPIILSQLYEVRHKKAQAYYSLSLGRVEQQPNFG